MALYQFQLMVLDIFLDNMCMVKVPTSEQGMIHSISLVYKKWMFREELV